MFLGNVTKQPAERFPLAVDYSAAGVLPSGTLISSGTVAAIDLSDNSDASATVLDATVLSLNAAGTKATCGLKAGTDGKDYKLTFTVTLDSGSPPYVLEDDATLRIRAR